MNNRILLCSECGAKNKIPKKVPKGKTVCGNCKSHISVKGKNRSFLSSIFFVILKLWFVWVLIIIFGVLSYLEENDNEVVHPSNFYQSAKIQEPSFNEPPMNIDHGVVSKSFTTGVAPLEIKTQFGKNYYVKVVNTRNNQVALTAYIIGGRSFEVLMPLGGYEIRYAAGDTWYGAQHYFGPKTSYSKANQEFKFTDDGYQYSGYTVELIMQTHGNLRTVNIDETDF